MRNGSRISVIIPAINEAGSIANVINDIPDWVDEIIVADNGSTDDTVQIATDNGAHVVHEAQRGYGAACLRGMQALTTPDIVVFLDGDYSDHPEQMDTLVDPIINDQLDIVIGSRALGKDEPGALTPQARFGNQLACILMRIFWGVNYTDLGPFRAIRYTSLTQLRMADTNYGWTVEMQIKATLRKLREGEVPVDYRKRIGRSKVSGTVRGVIGAGYKILSTIFLSAMRYHLIQKKKLAKRRRLIIFTRYPEPGSTKTRLIPTLGAQGAADLQKSMTEHALSTARAMPDIEIQICYTGSDETAMREWLEDGVHFAEQYTGDLGDRMRHAFQQAFEDGIDNTIIIGIDCPAITATILETAFDELYTHPLTIGPATDGGYYLIGMQRVALESLNEKLFTDIEWGTDTVYPTTINRVGESDLDFARLAYLNDVDEAEDLSQWERVQDSDSIPALTIIIPALNEEDSIATTLEAIPRTESIEVIVVDGGSEDETISIARDHGAKIIQSPRGRATQMNTGSAHASSDTLLFLHADTHLPETFLQDIQQTLARPNTACGAFLFATTKPTRSMTIITYFTNLRARWFNLPYGDQALFIPRKYFHLVSGYQDLPIMEDYLLVRALAKHGKIRITNTSATTSARRWHTLGPWRTLLTNQLVVLGYKLNFPPEKLARLYHQTPR